MATCVELYHVTLSIRCQPAILFLNVLRQRGSWRERTHYLLYVMLLPTLLQKSAHEYFLHAREFLADSAGRAYATVLRLSS